MSIDNNSSFTLKTILEKEKLNGTNLLEWHCNLRLVLKMAKKLHVLDGPVPLEPENNTLAARKVLEKHNDDSTEVACIMLATMSSELAKGLEYLGSYDMLEQLKGMFQKQAHQERFDNMKQLISLKWNRDPLYDRADSPPSPDVRSSSPGAQ
ncbi:uncharacterized protein LOC143558142 [Bidens hawaiensis]|uniref:uncharacterized protein LOC143558142 n=1 Tax=Bidens hawaiensis TaxID=980011 RepID=UPI00404A597A